MATCSKVFVAQKHQHVLTEKKSNFQSSLQLKNRSIELHLHSFQSLLYLIRESCKMLIIKYFPYSFIYFLKINCNIITMNRV